MMNQIVLVGRLVKDIELKELENGGNAGTITLAVPRNFKNENGEYETDFIDCILWGNIAKNTVEYCRIGDLIGIKGRVQTRNIEKEDGTKSYKLEIVAEKVTFLTSKKVDEE